MPAAESTGWAAWQSWPSCMRSQISAQARVDTIQRLRTRAQLIHRHRVEWSLRRPDHIVQILLAIVDVEQSGFRPRARALRLRPGMLLVADIVLETRTLATWLLAPLRWQSRA